MIDFLYIKNKNSVARMTPAGLMPARDGHWRHADVRTPTRRRGAGVRHVARRAGRAARIVGLADDAALRSADEGVPGGAILDRKSTRLNSSHANISYAVFCLKKKKNHHNTMD